MKVDRLSLSPHLLDIGVAPFFIGSLSRKIAMSRILRIAEHRLSSISEGTTLLYSDYRMEEDMLSTGAKKVAANRSWVQALWAGLFVAVSAGAAIDKTSTVDASGDGSVYDLKATAAGTLRVCTKARHAGDRWRVTIAQSITAAGVSAVGTGSASAFTGCATQAVTAGTQYVVIVTWERPLPGTFPASVIVHFTGPTDATNPPVTGVTGTALTALSPRPTSFVEAARGCPADGSTLTCGALLTCRFDSTADLDNFRFSVPANSEVSLRVCGPTDASYWQVYDPSGRLLAGAFGLGTAKLTAAGVHTIQTGDTTGTVGAYSLSLEGISQAYQCAVPLAFTQTKSGTFDACADVDTFQFTCKANQVISVSLVGPSEATAWNLHGPDGTLLGGAFGLGTATCATAGTHVIRVLNTSGTTGAYNITLQALTR